MKRLIEIDPITRDETWIERTGRVDGEYNIVRVQHVDPHIDANKEKQKNQDYQDAGIKAGGMGMHYAHIPNVLLEMWLKQGKIRSVLLNNQDDMNAVKKLLRNPEYKYLRVGTKIG